jgi:hypothetical protein
MAKETSDAGARGFTLGASPDPPEEATGAARMPKIDFSTFVISLGTSALYHMGFVNDPEAGAPPEKNVPLARQTIDTLEMLAAKTRGNLDEEEDKLLASLLYELRMRCVEVDE